MTIALIPRPGMLYVLARSLGDGRDAGLRSSYGTGLGGLVHVVAAAIGLSAIIAASAAAFSVVKYLGIVSVALNTVVDVIVAVGAGPISDQHRAKPHLWRRRQTATGGILIGLGVYAAGAGHLPSS